VRTVPESDSRISWSLLVISILKLAFFLFASSQLSFNRINMRSMRTQGLRISAFVIAAVLPCTLTELARGISCRPITVAKAFDNAQVVFRGRIVEVHDAEQPILAEILQPRKRIAVFHVTRVWKGVLGEKFEMPVVEFNYAPAGYDQFWANFLVVGNDLLVYAVRPKGAKEYTTSPCWRTSPAKTSKDFQELGPGWEP